jgi:hypothetical protein
MASGVEMVRGQAQVIKPKGKPKFPPRTEERARITTMAAAGLSQNKIAQTVGRSRHMVKNVLAEPEIQRSIQDERAELSALCKDKARAIFVSIGSGDIDKSNLLQKATAGAIMIDKALLLAGEATGINVTVLMDVVDAIRSRPQVPAERPRQAPALSRLSEPLE